VFTNIVPVIPAANLAWSTNNLGSGILSIISSPTSPPKITGMTTSQGNLVFTGSNGPANYPYTVLTSTDMSLPLSEWTSIATNNFDGNGNFNFTNSIDPDTPQSYYLLQLQ